MKNKTEKTLRLLSIQIPISKCNPSILPFFCPNSVWKKLLTLTSMFVSRSKYCVESTLRANFQLLIFVLIVWNKLIYNKHDMCIWIAWFWGEPRGHHVILGWMVHYWHLIWFQVDLKIMHFWQRYFMLYFSWHFPHQWELYVDR